MQLMILWPDRHVELAWIDYIAPCFAPLVRLRQAPSSSARRGAPLGGGDGRKTFRVENPAYLSDAQDILAALADFEDLPWPPDAQPE